MSGHCTTCENTVCVSCRPPEELHQVWELVMTSLWVSGLGTKTTESQVRPRAQNWHNVFERVSNALRLDRVEMHIFVMNPQRRGWLPGVFLASPLLFILLAVTADQKISGGDDVTWPHKENTLRLLLGERRGGQKLASIGKLHLMHQSKHLTGEQLASILQFSGNSTGLCVKGVFNQSSVLTWLTCVILSICIGVWHQHDTSSRSTACMEGHW